MGSKRRHEKFLEYRRRRLKMNFQKYHHRRRRCQRIRHRQRALALWKSDELLIGVKEGRTEFVANSGGAVVTSTTLVGPEGV